jgi:glycosyl transferase family 25
MVNEGALITYGSLRERRLACKQGSATMSASRAKSPPRLLYDRIRIVNLRERDDRRREMLGELKRLHLTGDPRVQFFEAVAPADGAPWRSRGERGCYLSHLGILEEAMQAGESVLILEDDCDFTDAAASSDWGARSQIFYGGFGSSDYSALAESNIQGSHCMGFSRDVVPLAVAFLRDLAARPSPPPIDGAYVRLRRAHPEIKTEFAVPQVAVQRQSASDIAPGRFDGSAWLRWPVQILRRLNRGRYRRRKMLEGVREQAEP